MCLTNLHQDLRRALLGLLPLGFLVYAYHSYANPWELLWLCNVTNLVLAAAILSRSHRLLWLATLALLIGAPMWGIHLVVVGEFMPHSFLTHIIAPGMGLALIRGGPRAPGIWKYALAYGVAVQLLCWAISPPELNLNLSHRPYFSMDGILSNYWAYWSLSFISIALVLIVLERLIGRYLAE